MEKYYDICKIKRESFAIMFYRYCSGQAFLSITKAKYLPNKGEETLSGFCKYFIYAVRNVARTLLFMNYKQIPAQASVLLKPKKIEWNFQQSK